MGYDGVSRAVVPYRDLASVDAVLEGHIKTSALARAERLAIRLRRSPLVRDRAGVWDKVRPLYRRALGRAGEGGLLRTMNGTDDVLISPEMYTLADTYEPDVWHAFMAELRPGDRVADVGASMGLYTIAAARRVGSAGHIYAFEPDPASARLLREHIRLNDVGDRVTVHQAAVGETDGIIGFKADNGLESRVLHGETGGIEVPVVRLDNVLGNRPVDVLKIDVEGFEEAVLRGAERLLRGPEPPRCIYVEVHPFAWEEFGASSDGLLGELVASGYAVFDLEGTAVEHVSEYGEVVARRV